MIFKPRIFISSTFNENKSVCESIREYFYSVGAEPLLYENELTPSTIPKTYRTNLLDADFVILIVKEEYGTETEYGISGTHEEYKIAYSNKIPLHVYLKKDKASDENPLIKDLKRDGISYYYFDNDDDLLKRLKETTFTIAKEIMINQITKSKLSKNTIMKLAGDMDYNRAMEVISIIESMKNCVKVAELDFIYSSLFVDCLECINYEFSSIYHQFNNWEIENLLSKLLNISKTYMEHSGVDFTSIGIFREYKINILGKIRITKLSYKKNSDWGIDDYKKCLKDFFEVYEEFKNIVQKFKIEIDIIE